MPQVSQLSHTNRLESKILTLSPTWDNLKGVDELRIKAGSKLDTHTGREEHEVEPSQVRLPVPRSLVLLDDASKDRVDLGLLLALEDTHD